jgi:hypothetical protein
VSRRHAAASLACLLATALSGCSSGEVLRTTDARSTPGEVVREFVAAATSGHRALVRSLSTERHWRELSSETDHLLNNPTRVTHLRIITVRRLEAGSRQVPRGLRSGQIASVTISFVARQARVITRPDGLQAWGYYLVRDGDDEPWRVDAEGLG